MTTQLNLTEKSDGIVLALIWLDVFNQLSSVNAAIYSLAPFG